MGDSIPIWTGETINLTLSAETIVSISEMQVQHRYAIFNFKIMYILHLFYFLNRLKVLNWLSMIRVDSSAIRCPFFVAWEQTLK